MDCISEILNKEAKKSYINHQISCVIVYNGQVISKGYNRGLVHTSLKNCCVL